VEVLADGFGQFAGEWFEVAAVLQQLKGFLDIPLMMPL